MGRGLSDQQVNILAAGVAINAARNGGTPAPAIVLIDHAAGVVENTMFGPRPRRRRYVMTAAVPELSDGFVLVAFGGFRRAAVEYSSARRWVSIDHKKRVSLERAVKSLVARGLIARTPSPRHFEGPWNREGDRSRWNDEQHLAARTYETLAEPVADFWKRWRRFSTPAYTLLPVAFDAVGDAWRDVDGAAMVARFDHAEGLEWQRQNRERRRTAAVPARSGPATSRCPS
jgi:hypothetical protein